jgi:uncharacterized protein
VPVFECDPHKSQANLLKHGLSLVEAEQLWLDPARTYDPADATSTETRYGLIARHQGKIWRVTFTLRGGIHRLISCRAARKKEARAYFGRGV